MASEAAVRWEDSEVRYDREFLGNNFGCILGLDKIDNMPYKFSQAFPV
jgi:hypothetical protein